jgi:biopolymer transport protein ExbD
MATLTASQLAYVRRTARRAEPKADEGELNIIPFLDIVMNVVMFLLASLATVFTASIPVPVDHPGPTHGPPPPEFTVQIVPQGYIVANSEGYLQPGCARSGGATISVPTRVGTFDTAALTSCLLAARLQPQWQSIGGASHEIQVAGAGGVPYRVIVQTLDALRESRPGAGDMFTTPHLGVLN